MQLRPPSNTPLQRSLNGAWFGFIVFLTASCVPAANVERIGTIDPEIKECSGVVVSHRFPDVFWVHSDGAREHLYAINRKGGIIAEFKVKGADFHDWEDITLDTNNNLYAADTGDNN